MQPMHPALVEAHARARVEQWRREAPDRPRPLSRRPGRHRLRTSAGWFLIHVGFRLALPAGPIAPVAG